MYQKNPLPKPQNFYDFYDYMDFWKGRDFEDHADQVAIARLIKKIPPPHREIVDIGGGIGRIIPLYEKFWKHAVLMDASFTQLNVAKKRFGHPGKIDFIQGSAEDIPLPAGSCDAAVCIRMFHYTKEPRTIVREIGRVLGPGGYLILEIPNKIHAKARIKSFFSGNNIHSHEPISRSIREKDIPFFNHHPEAIQDILLTEWFEIIEVLSVSNLRSSFLKRILPASLLLSLEKRLQGPLGAMWFGPSIYFLARKKNIEEK